MDDEAPAYRKPFAATTSWTTEAVSVCEDRSSSRLGLGGEVVRKAVKGFLCIFAKKVESRSVRSDAAS